MLLVNGAMIQFQSRPIWNSFPVAIRSMNFDYQPADKLG